MAFEKLNKILISRVRFFDYVIIFRSTKMLAQIADLRLCTLTSLHPFVLAPLCPCIPHTVKSKHRQIHRLTELTV